MTDRPLTLSASLHFIAFRAGETTAVVKTTPPSHMPAETTCRIWMTVLKAPPFSVPRRPRKVGPRIGVKEGDVHPSPLAALALRTFYDLDNMTALLPQSGHESEEDVVRGAFPTRRFSRPRKPILGVS